MLQRLAENFQYAELINFATNESNQHKRLAYLAAFNISAFGFNSYRTLKSFNPILGETYEYIDNELGFKFFSEQVSHHPPVSACNVLGTNYEAFCNNKVKTKFNLFKGALFITPISRTYINLFELKEKYSCSKPIIGVKGLIFGKMRIEIAGKFEVTNHTTGDICYLEIFEESETNKLGTIKGEIKNSKGEQILLIEGNILSNFDILYPNENNRRETLWRRIEDIGSDDESHFYFTKFVANLNNIPEDLAKVLPETDSRFRKDQRALENQEYEFAEKEKLRLEAKQRAARKLREEENKTYQVVYYKEVKDEITGEIVYIPSRDYWEDRKNKTYPLSQDIFG